MQAVLLNGAASPSDPTSALCAEVARQLGAQFETVRIFHLAGLAIAHCLGEFDCFVKTPGRRRIHDEGQEIERAAHDADLLVLLTPLRYGGYAPHLKKAVDRLLPLISPFLRKVAGMTHPVLRYERSARWAALAVDETPSPERALLFRALVESNALNFGSPAWGMAVVGRSNCWPIARAPCPSTTRMTVSSHSAAAAPFTTCVSPPLRQVGRPRWKPCPTRRTPICCRACDSSPVRPRAHRPRCTTPLQPAAPTENDSQTCRSIPSPRGR